MSDGPEADAERRRGAGARRDGFRRHLNRSPRPRRGRRAGRRFLHVLALLTAIVAALFVTLFAVDLGPLVREEAEQRSLHVARSPDEHRQGPAAHVPGCFEFTISSSRGSRRRTVRSSSEELIVSLPWWTRVQASPGHRVGRA